MITNYEEGPPEPRPCRHRWTFHCWVRDPIADSERLTYRVERCRRCPKARLVLYLDGERARCLPTVCDDIAEALLGEVYTYTPNHAAVACGAKLGR